MGRNITHNTQVRMAFEPRTERRAHHNNSCRDAVNLFAPDPQFRTPPENSIANCATGGVIYDQAGRIESSVLVCHDGLVIRNSYKNPIDCKKFIRSQKQNRDLASYERVRPIIRLDDSTDDDSDVVVLDEDPVSDED